MTHNQRESEKKGKQKQDEREALLEKTRQAREGRLRHQSPPHEDEGHVPNPPSDDPRHGDPTIPPGQTDVPTGGTTGSAMGGSSKRKKDHAG